MLNPEAPAFPFGWERAFRSAAPSALFHAVAALLVDRGYRVEESEPSSADDSMRDFSGGLHAVRETVLDARRRQIGKAAVIGAVVLTFTTLGLVVSLLETRWILEWLLTIIVIGGGLGLSQLRNPPKRVRRIVDVRFTASDQDVTLSVREGVGRVDEAGLSEWLAGEVAEIGEAEIDELARRVSDVSREGTVA